MPDVRGKLKPPKRPRPMAKPNLDVVVGGPYRTKADLPKPKSAWAEPGVRERINDQRHDIERLKHDMSELRAIVAFAGLALVLAAFLAATLLSA